MPILPNHQFTFPNHATAGDDVRAALEKSSIIPDVLDDDFTPKVVLSLSYPSSRQVVHLGNTLPPSDVSSSPAFEIHTLSTPDLSPTHALASNITYTLVLTDPDATSRVDPAKAQMCHWIATDIKLTPSTTSSGMEETNAYNIIFSPTLTAANVTELISYQPPSPPPKTGFHRYVFILLAPALGRGEQLKKPKDRPHWGYGKVGKGVREWAADNDLVAVGANFFFAENEKQ